MLMEELSAVERNEIERRIRHAERYGGPVRLDPWVARKLFEQSKIPDGLAEENKKLKGDLEEAESAAAALRDELNDARREIETLERQVLEAKKKST